MRKCAHACRKLANKHVNGQLALLKVHILILFFFTGKGQPSPKLQTLGCHNFLQQTAHSQNVSLFIFISFPLLRNGPLECCSQHAFNKQDARKGPKSGLELRAGGTLGGLNRKCFSLDKEALLGAKIPPNSLYSIVPLVTNHQTEVFP